MYTNRIKELIEGMLKAMQVAFEAVEVGESDGRQRFTIKTPDSNLLIGVKGANLLALNHLVRKMASAKGTVRAPSEKTPAGGTPHSAEGEREIAFFVDVNGYQEAALETIKNTAKVMGERARSFKASVELEPMSSYERMVVHAYFQDVQDLKTESVGEGDRRRVVIKYVGI